MSPAYFVTKLCRFSEFLNGFFCRKVVYYNRLKQPMPFSCTVGTEEQGKGPVASFTPDNCGKTKKENEGMAKSLEALSEVVTNQKHPFRKVDNQPKKPLKHRYERRKIKEYLHLGEWLAGETA